MQNAFFSRVNWPPLPSFLLRPSPLSATQSVYPSAHSLPPLLYSQSPLPGMSSGHVAGIIHSCDVCSVPWSHVGVSLQSPAAAIHQWLNLPRKSAYAMERRLWSSRVRGVRKKALKLQCSSTISFSTRSPCITSLTGPPWVRSHPGYLLIALSANKISLIGH